MDGYTISLLVVLALTALYVILAPNKKKPEPTPEPEGVGMQEAVENWEKRQATAKIKRWNETVAEYEERQDTKPWSPWPPAQPTKPSPLPTLTGGTSVAIDPPPLYVEPLPPPLTLKLATMEKPAKPDIIHLKRPGRPPARKTTKAKKRKT